jgi:hypothetical protein
MNVKVMLKHGLDRVIEKDIVVCEINSGEKVVDILKQINFPTDRECIVLVDGKKSVRKAHCTEAKQLKYTPTASMRWSYNIRGIHDHANSQFHNTI